MHVTETVHCNFAVVTCLTHNCVVVGMDKSLHEFCVENLHVEKQKQVTETPSTLLHQRDSEAVVIM